MQKYYNPPKWRQHYFSICEPKFLREICKVKLCGTIATAELSRCTKKGN